MSEKSIIDDKSKSSSQNITICLAPYCTIQTGGTRYSVNYQTILRRSDHEDPSRQKLVHHIHDKLYELTNVPGLANRGTTGSGAEGQYLQSHIRKGMRAVLMAASKRVKGFEEKLAKTFPTNKIDIQFYPVQNQTQGIPIIEDDCEGINHVGRHVISISQARTTVDIEKNDRHLDIWLASIREGPKSQPAAAPSRRPETFQGYTEEMQSLLTFCVAPYALILVGTMRPMIEIQSNHFVSDMDNPPRRAFMDLHHHTIYCWSVFPPVNELHTEQSLQISESVDEDDHSLIDSSTIYDAKLKALMTEHVMWTCNQARGLVRGFGKTYGRPTHTRFFPVQDVKSHLQGAVIEDNSLGYRKVTEEDFVLTRFRTIIKNVNGDKHLDGYFLSLRELERVRETRISKDTKVEDADTDDDEPWWKSRS